MKIPKVALILIFLSSLVSGCQSSGIKIRPDNTGSNPTLLKISTKGSNSFKCNGEIANYYADKTTEMGYSSILDKYHVTVRKVEPAADRSLHMAIQCDDRWYNIFAEAEGEGDRTFLLVPDIEQKENLQ